MVTEAEVLQSLSHVQDPDLNKDIVALGFIQSLKIQDGEVSFDIKLTTPACPVREQLKEEAIQAVSALSGVKKVEVRLTSDVKKHAPFAERRSIPGVRNVIAVGSGKGGVGKSTVATNLACGFSKMGARVGLLDADIYGPSIPLLMGVTDGIQVLEGNKIKPAEAHGVKIMSMGFMAKGDQPLIWRGPMAHKALEQCLFEVLWGELDYLFVDLPPGTGDIHLTLAQSIDLVGAVIVSTPQDLGLMISRKTLRMFQKTNVTILGMLENMSYHICSKCGSKEDIFGHGTVEGTAKELEIPYLGAIPLNATIRKGSDQGFPAVLNDKVPDMQKQFDAVVGRVAQEISIANFKTNTEATKSSS